MHQRLTVVVVENAGRESEPYVGHPPCDDQCLVFGQHGSESAFLLDVRLRDRLDHLRAQGVAPNSAVLFWDSAECERDVLRRTQLMARKLGRGAHITLATYRESDPHLEARLRQFTAQARRQLEAEAITVTLWFPERAASEVPAPLSAAWNRVQRLRERRAAESQAPEALPSASLVA
jgi:hypothetical protein